MHKMNSYYFCILLIACAVMAGQVYSQEIKLNDLKRSYSKTNETNGILLCALSYKFNATVKLSKQLEDYTTVQFDIKKNDTYAFLFDVSIAYECSGFVEDTNHNCKRTGDGVFSIEASVHGEIGDMVRGQIIHYNKTVLAYDLKELPGSNGATDSTGVLKINDQPISDEMNCSKTIDANDLRVEFFCSNHISPCEIQIKADEIIVLNQTVDHARFERHVERSRDLLLEIKYGACGFKKNVKAMSCIIKSDFDESVSAQGIDAEVIIIISVIGAVFATLLILLLVMLLIKRRAKPNKENITRLKENTNDKTSNCTNHSSESLGLDEQVKDNDMEKALLGNEETQVPSPDYANMNLFDATKSVSFQRVQEIITDNPDCVNDQDENGWTAIMHASQNGCKQIADFLIDHKSDICIKDNEGMNALMIACKYEQMDIETVLLKHMENIKGMCLLPGFSPQENVKSYINEANIFGQTPLILATILGNELIAHDLLSYNADVNISDAVGNTALMYASHYGYESIARSLLKKYPEVNSKNKLGRTSLMLASEKGYTEIVKMLLEHGALVEETDYQGYTALALAKWNNQTEVITILREYGLC